MLCPAVATSAVRHALNLVSLLCFISFGSSFQFSYRIIQCHCFSKTQFRIFLSIVDMSHSELCSVCGSSCSYLPITDEVGEFDIFTVDYCLVPQTG